MWEVSVALNYYQLSGANAPFGDFTSDPTQGGDIRVARAELLYYRSPTFDVVPFFPVGSPVLGGTPITIRGDGFLSGLPTQQVWCTFSQRVIVQTIAALTVTDSRIVCRAPPQNVQQNQTDVVLSKISVTLNNATYYPACYVLPCPLSQQFVQYLNVTISALQPILGPANTRGYVRITGQNLQSLVFYQPISTIRNAYSEHFPSLNLSSFAGLYNVEHVYFGMVCRFEKDIVQAIYVPAAQLIECRPQVGNAGTLAVSISLNGFDFTPPIDFLAYDRPVLTDSFPQGIYEGQRSDLNVSGGIFPTSKDDLKNLLCRIRLSENDKTAGAFPADYLGPHKIRCKGTPIFSQAVLPTLITNALLDVTFNNQDYTAPMLLTVIPKMFIYRLEPSAGPNEGGTVVTVIGANFAAPLGAKNLLCKFGTNELSVVAGRLLSSTSILCVVPRNSDTTGGNKRVYVQLSSNGLDYFPDWTIFLYYVQVRARRPPISVDPQTHATYSLHAACMLPWNCRAPFDAGVWRRPKSSR